MVPVVISVDDWIDTRDHYNLIFDRVRIQRALFGKYLLDDGLRDEIETWCKSKLKEQ